jgi:hypothetical protein
MIPIIILFLQAEIAKPKPPESKSIPPAFTTELQALSQENQSIQMLQEVSRLKQENLRLRICAEVGIKPADCIVDWKTLQVLEKPKPVPVQTPPK